MARPVARRGEGRERVLAAALDLFAVHGISGTSLQMIAESLGVTKASVYFQFRTKGEIVVAVLEPATGELRALVEQAGTPSDPAARRELAVTGVVDLVVRHRRLVAILRGDPAMAELRSGHPELGELIDRLGALLVGTRPDPAVLVTMAVLGGGLMLTGLDPDLVALDDATLRTELLRCARALVGSLPPPV